MEIAVFAKKGNTKEGKTFYRYLSTLKRKDNSEQLVAVKFREDCGQPKAEKCPMNIKFEKKDGNLSKREYLDEATGEVREAFTLWISKWSEGKPYEDHSLDDFA